ncbi:UNVERIFIED_CONTAM: hypothetical protein GTU68_029150 [Idotea baltica]|nr:hypothetical protein [Idotea baltica]
MRTPGHDLELGMGFLFTEGIVNHPDEIRRIEHCQLVKAAEEVGNVVKAELQPEIEPDMNRLQRHFYTTSSCGVCGKASIEALQDIACTVYPDLDFKVTSDVIHSLPVKTRGGQTVFRHTGGIHATGLFDAEGNLEVLREDVGRHNALDKVIGHQFHQGKLPLSQTIALCSGRLGFELVQKSLRAGIPILCAVGAPSSLAVKLAREYGMTLVGFVRDGRFNIYAGADRILISPDLPPSQ